MPKKPYAASVSGILEGCWKTLENLKKISARLCKCNKKHAQNLSFQTCFLLKLAERKGFEPLCGLTRKLISSRSRHSDFEGKRRIFADIARAWKPLKNQHFSALGGKKPRKVRCTKEFEKNLDLGKKSPVGENLGRTRGEKHSDLQITPTLYRD